MSYCRNITYKSVGEQQCNYERTSNNLSDDDKVFARVDVKNGNEVLVRYQYDNHLGSACLELDHSADIISYEEYHPFGTTSYRAGRSETEVSLKRYKYCGKERDEETGLYYYGARYYAAWLCRFVSVDPLQHKYPYYTPYQYAGNKPITYIDLDGLEEAKIDELNFFIPPPEYVRDATINIPPRTNTTTTDFNFNNSEKINLKDSYVIPLKELHKPTYDKIQPQTTTKDISLEMEKIEAKKNPYKNLKPNHNQTITRIGPYNPQGFSSEFDRQLRWQNEIKYRIDELNKIGRDLSPITFGGPGFGIGSNIALMEGFRQVPGIVIPELMIAKLTKPAKLLSLKEFSTVTKGISNSNLEEAYQLYKSEVMLRNINKGVINKSLNNVVDLKSAIETTVDSYEKLQKIK